MGLDNVGKTDIINAYMDTLPPEVRHEVLEERSITPGVTPYLAHAFVNKKHLQLILQDTLSFDDPVMTGTYLKNQAGVFLVVDPSNKEALNIEKLSEMINLAAERSNNQKLNVKLLVNNPGKVSMGDMEQIEKWAQESHVTIVRLATPLNGEQIKKILYETLAEIVELMDNKGYEKTLEQIWGGELQHFGISVKRERTQL